MYTKVTKGTPTHEKLVGMMKKRDVSKKQVKELIGKLKDEYPNETKGMHDVGYFTPSSVYMGGISGFYFPNEAEINKKYWHVEEIDNAFICSPKRNTNFGKYVAELMRGVDYIEIDDFNEIIGFGSRKVKDKLFNYPGLSWLENYEEFVLDYSGVEDMKLPKDMEEITYTQWNSYRK